MPLFCFLRGAELCRELPVKSALGYSEFFCCFLAVSVMLFESFPDQVLACLHDGQIILVLRFAFLEIYIIFGLLPGDIRFRHETVVVWSGHRKRLRLGNYSIRLRLSHMELSGSDNFLQILYLCVQTI